MPMASYALALSYYLWPHSFAGSVDFVMFVFVLPSTLFRGPLRIYR